MTQHNEYDAELLEQINESVDLIEYVNGQGLDLEQKGERYFTHCSRHVDNTPSLCFFSGTNTFHCFSCGATGGIIQYLYKYEGLDYDESVEKAANLSKIDMKKMCASKTIRFLKSYKASSQSKCSQTVHLVLPQNTLDKYSHEPITEWLDEGMEQEVIDLFEIAIDGKSNRIVYPVYDIDGKLINVKGRTRYENYKELRIPKYMNYFKIGTMDYFQCLDKTLPFIKKTGEVIIFESIKSVIKAYGWGYKNCISAEKHTLTPEQVDLLIKLRVDIVFAYDSDVNYYLQEVDRDIVKLKRITNVYIIQDRYKLLGGAEAKNAPVDCGKEIWEQLYDERKRVS